MATIPAQSSEIVMKLRLSQQARQNLEQRAAENGQDVEGFTSQLVERAVTNPTIDEILAPVRKQVADSGMSDQQLDDFFRSQLEAHRRDKKAKTA